MLETYQQYIQTTFTVLLTTKQVSKAKESGMLEINLLQESYLIVLPVSSLPTYLFV